MAYFDKYGVRFSNDKKTLERCPSDFNGEYVIPDGVTCIGHAAFAYCTGLTNVTISNSVIDIEYQSFFYCTNLRSISIPPSVASIGFKAFAGCTNLKSVTILNSTIDFGMGVFQDCPSLPIIDNIRYADTYLVEVADKALSTYTIKEGTMWIGYGAFEGCTNLTDIVIPNSVTSIGWFAFSRCSSLNKIEISNNVIVVGLNAFYNCPKLNEIIIPKGQYARFVQMYGLKDLTNIFVECESKKDILARTIKEKQEEEHRRLEEQQLQEMLQDSILFFDTETTGTPRNYKAPVTDSYNWPRLVQLAWIMADKDGNVLKRKSVIIKPEGFSIPADATAVHGITTERAQKEGLPLHEVLEEFVTDLSLAKQIVGHNIEFDKNIVGAELYRFGMDYAQLMDKPSTCTMKSSTDYCAIPNPNGYFGYKWPSLQELYFKLFNRNFVDAHDALADITATKECFFELRKRGVI